MRIFVSGLHSGPNPLPGIGVARSLRAAFPEATLIGIDYSDSSSGLSWPDFDDVEFPGHWHEIDFLQYAADIKGKLCGDAYWVSCLDLETIWFAERVASRGILGPAIPALRRTAKPAASAARALKLCVPRYLFLDASDRDLFSFLTSLGWRVWLKGPYYSALPIRSWQEFERQRCALGELWSTCNGLFLQEHIDGQHESIAFAARDGALLGAVGMQKTETTIEGKTWAGKIFPIEKEVENSLRQLLHELKWTGGAEIECIRDPLGLLWLMEWNPRFPAWIHGATLAGYNLPASLISNTEAETTVVTDVTEFTRVVLEVPKRPQAATTFGAGLSAVFIAGTPHVMELKAAHPSGMPLLSWRLSGSDTLETFQTSSIASIALPIRRTFCESLQNIVETPSFHYLVDIAEERFTTLSEIEREYSSPTLRFAYSVKTNPDRRLVALAHAKDLLFEAITCAELEYILSTGADTSCIILNGPAKLWASKLPIGRSRRLHAVFFDSLQEFNRVCSHRAGVAACLADTIGFRVRPTNCSSRFGIRVGSDCELHALKRAIEAIPEGVAVGLHFHVASSVIGMDTWLGLYESVVEIARAIEGSSSRTISLLDVGGGFTPDAWDKFVDEGSLRRVHAEAMTLKSCEEVVFELGKAVAEPCFMLVARIVDVLYHSDHGVESVVCDASIAEAPQIKAFPHRLFFVRQGGLEALPAGRGNARLVGRLCMEEDVLFENISVPSELAHGDFVLIGDVGAYDYSMSYHFGIGCRDGGGQGRE